MNAAYGQTAAIAKTVQCRELSFAIFIIINQSIKVKIYTSENTPLSSSLTPYCAERWFSCLQSVPKNCLDYLSNFEVFEFNANQFHTF